MKCCRACLSASYRQVPAIVPALAVPAGCVLHGPSIATLVHPESVTLLLLSLTKFARCVCGACAGDEIHELTAWICDTVAMPTAQA